jgi:hypothetical protein
MCLSSWSWCKSQCAVRSQTLKNSDRTLRVIAPRMSCTHPLVVRALWTLLFLALEETVLTRWGANWQRLWPSIHLSVQNKVFFTVAHQRGNRCREKGLHWRVSLYIKGSPRPVRISFFQPEPAQPKSPIHLLQVRDAQPPSFFGLVTLFQATIQCPPKAFFLPLHKKLLLILSIALFTQEGRSMAIVK